MRRLWLLILFATIGNAWAQEAPLIYYPRTDYLSDEYYLLTDVPNEDCGSRIYYAPIEKITPQEAYAIYQLILYFHEVSDVPNEIYQRYLRQFGLEKLPNNSEPIYDGSFTKIEAVEYEYIMANESGILPAFPPDQRKQIIHAIEYKGILNKLKMQSKDDLRYEIFRNKYGMRRYTISPRTNRAVRLPLPSSFSVTRSPKKSEEYRTQQKALLVPILKHYGIGSFVSFSACD